MKRTAFVALAALALTSSAQLIPFFTDRKQPAAPGARTPDRLNQKPMAGNQLNNPGIQLPPSNTDNDNPSSGPPTGDVILSDVLGTQPSIQIFAGFTLDIPSVSSRLNNGNQNTTVLAPLNRAITSLPRKPWEDAREYAALGAEAYSGSEGEDRAQRNLRRFAEAHIVPVSPWKEGEKVQSLGGGTVWWEKRDGKTLVMPGSVEVEGVVSRVANGEVWVVKEVVNYT
ncbi:hypothetical protein BDY17DRAFT_162311 [Neohortaea acidophila]|uniref:FAS1 domain-containing protein n=1 Tax=Neohortaea acidophila TaxID=245834 RepID=A0A6A6PSB9_9PEZI|nr:uncharacterized protein BDY17DRAFT_162311 [Neohortaea acidophila]KAF2482581.1 hypothetical protein BDY17DRAFT_162311 [Neohortaea acidophila]